MPAEKSFLVTQSFPPGWSSAANTPFSRRRERPSCITVCGGKLRAWPEQTRVKFDSDLGRRFSLGDIYYRKDQNGSYVVTRTFSLVALAALFAQSGLGVAEAQLVQVGPGYVKAPFVRVYRTPEGTVVRAPFTRVERGAPAYGRQHVPSPYAGSYNQGYAESAGATDSADMSATERRRRKLAVFARRLDQDLTRFTTGAHWQDYLQLPYEVVLLDHRVTRGVTLEPDLAELQAALANFESVSHSYAYRRVARLGSFRATHHHLKAYVSILQAAAVDSPTPTPRSSTITPDNAGPSVVLPPAADQPHEELPLPELKLQP